MANAQNADADRVRGAAFLMSVLRIPLHLLSLLSQAKSFRNNPIMGSPLLNRLGLHVIRTVLAYGMTHLRWWMLSPLVPKDERKRYQRDGFLLIEDFLPDDLFREFEAEARAYRGAGWEMSQGDTLTQHVFLDDEVFSDLPATRKVLQDRRFRRLLKYTGSHAGMPQMFLQRIANGYGNGQDDPQKKLHKDTFHPTIKSWLFVDDVGPERGPFTYVPTSHRLTWKRLAWEYRQSLTARNAKNSHHASGSFRVSDDALAAMALPAAEAVAVRRNTLVIANTIGFHCRGQAEGRISRLELWGMSRKNPFVPWPGIDTPIANRIESKIVRWVVGTQERKAEKAGRRPIWRTIDFDGSSN